MASYVKTGWYIPSVGQYIYKFSQGIAVKNEVGNFKTGAVPNSKYWLKLINRYGFNPPFKLTEYKSDSGHYVYVDPKDGHPLIFTDSGNLGRGFKGIVRIRKLIKAQGIKGLPMTNEVITMPKTVATPKAKSVPVFKTPAGLKNTGLKSTNGKNVHKNNAGKLYVLKNGKWTQQFKGKKALVIQPGPSHTKVTQVDSKFQRLGLLLKAIAKKKAALRKNNQPNTYKEYKLNHNKGFAFINRQDIFKFLYTSLEGMGEATGMTDWKDNLNTPKFIRKDANFEISYNQIHFASQLLFKYTGAKNFGNVKINQLIDVEWLQKQNKFIRSLTPREIFLAFGYSYAGDTIAHAYLDGRLEMSKFRASVTTLGTNYFPFFFQAREYYKMAMSDPMSDYPRVLARVKAETNIDAIKNIIAMFVSELNALILKSPSTTKPFVVFRGVKDDNYMTGLKDKQYVLNRFCSTSVNGEKAFEFSKPIGKTSGHALQRILILPGSKCLFMFGLTAFNGEFEILLPHGTVYTIRQMQKNVSTLGSTILTKKPDSSPQHKVDNLVDITVLGISKKYALPRATPVQLS